MKGKERKALAEKIQQTEEEISEKLDMLPYILKEDDYPDVQAFMATCREMEGVVEHYEREVWEYNLKLKQKEKPAKKPPLWLYPYTAVHIDIGLFCYANEVILAYYLYFLNICLKII